MGSNTSRAQRPKKETPPVSYYLNQKKILINLIALTFIWLTTSYNSFLIAYLLNNLDQVYINYVFTSISSFVGYSIGGYLYLSFGLKLSLGGAYLVQILAGVASLAFGLQHQNGWIFLIIWQFLQFGISTGFQVLYTSHTHLFPTLFSTTSFGIMNFVAQFGIILSPLVA